MTTTPPQRTILVIDDDDLVREVLTRMLEDLGYRSIAAADGPSGLAIVDAECPDAVLVDLTMPLMPGDEVVAALRTRKPGLPVVLCTGIDQEDHGPVDVTAFLTKPFRLETLKRLLRDLFANCE